MLGHYAQHYLFTKWKSLLVNPTDIRTKSNEFDNQIIIATINVMDIANLRFTISYKASQNHGCTGTQIRCLDLAAVELLYALDDRGAAVDAGEMQETVVAERPAGNDAEGAGLGKLGQRQVGHLAAQALTELGAEAVGQILILGCGACQR